MRQPQADANHDSPNRRRKSPLELYHEENQRIVKPT